MALALDVELVELALELELVELVELALDVELVELELVELVELELEPEPELVAIVASRSPETAQRLETAAR